MKGLPTEIAQELAKEHGAVKSLLPVQGGCISNTGKLITEKGVYFIKWNNTVPIGFFEAEAKGLQLLRKADAARVPQVLSFSPHYILLEYIETTAIGSKAWEKLGENLARLHQNHEAKHGLDYDNYIGSLPQYNEQNSSWIDFFMGQRLQKQLDLAANEGKPTLEVQEKFDKLYKILHELMPDAKPSLLHGDLWSGNVLASGDEPFIIDPAVYYGNREIEIAFTMLFGGFGSSFYESYQAHYPLESGFEERKDLYNLYPLLVHWNLFGDAYLSRIDSILRHYQR